LAVTFVEGGAGAQAIFARTIDPTRHHLPTGGELPMQLRSDSFSNEAEIPGEFAFDVRNPHTRTSLSANRNPDLTWSDVLEGTKSFVLILHAADVPSRADDVNKEGREIQPRYRE
jgi:phosphatidylethanolamine-binding protein (PEBP) family uncharacterized protein